MGDLELLILLKQILESFESQEEAIEWLRTPHPILNSSPLVAIASGKKSQVLWLIQNNYAFES